MPFTDDHIHGPSCGHDLDLSNEHIHNGCCGDGDFMDEIQVASSVASMDDWASYIDGTSPAEGAFSVGGTNSPIEVTASANQGNTAVNQGSQDQVSV